MKLLYLPAMSMDAFRNDWVRTPLNWMDPRLRGSTAHHPHALVSFVQWHRQPFAWEPDDFVFGDSGGYTVLTKGLIIDPRKVIRWQLRHSELGCILDTPAFAISQGDRVPPPWQECLRRTVAATEAALPQYLSALEGGARFRWQGVVHGRTTAELEEWWAAVSAVYPFTASGEGWAFKPQPENCPEGVARILSFIKSKGIRRAHFFASAGLDAVETLACLGPAAGLEHATFDSMSAVHHGYRRQLRLPGGGVLWTADGSAARRYMLEDCPCVSCRFVAGDLEEYADLIADPYWKHRIIFHNVLDMLAEFDGIRDRYYGNKNSSGLSVTGR